MATHLIEELTAILLQQVTDIHASRLAVKGHEFGEWYPAPRLMNDEIIVVDPWDDNGAPLGTSLFWIDNSDEDNPKVCARGQYGQVFTSEIIGGGDLILIQKALEY